ncbi:hypothetical protein EIN_094700 [Entamoeba invadens IP1]|uniref:Uncharacterized protein n=1 Tax=Entamoeba invadens IP1 TaxID=370355 RepID=A0A0A1U3B3_ENTIV|nr:hypothetical protein EIN_094700 [Entamoeba invadens IP1]ELP87243.1 hypothetical protein EIN_094700 [Entamoeba invadens IP1]|eukprot:XP_004254014.1 hypothetical protein EIN_094700 [Entamoeba invadens IP1]
MVRGLLLLLISFVATALPEVGDLCCFDKDGQGCDCMAVYTCNVPAMYFGSENTYLPPCAYDECKKNCIFADWLISIICTVGVFFVDLLLIGTLWLMCRKRCEN